MAPLPAEWEERQDTSGRTYYVNHRLKRTQWERPTGSDRSGMPDLIKFNPLRPHLQLPKLGEYGNRES